MRILNNIIRTLNVPVPLFDRILEMVALFMLVIMLVFTAFLYQQAPDQIPIHFNLNNEPTDFGEKSVYWYMALFFIAMMLLSAFSAYNKKFVNLPVRLKAPVIVQQNQLIARMCRYTTICLGMMWLDYLLSTSASYWNIQIFVAVFSKVTLFLLFVILVYYSVKIWWVGRKY